MRMQRLKKTLPLLMVALLSACANFKHPGAAKPVDAGKPAGDEAAITQKEDESQLPKAELTPEILYGVVAGEIAAQRGSVGASAVTYLELARQTRDPRLAQRAAEFSMFAGLLKETSEALTLWMELAPDSVPAREQLFITLLRAGKLAESKPLIEALLQKEPERAPAIFVQLARLTSRQSDKQAAYDLVKQFASRYPDLAEARFALLAVAAEAGDQATMNREFDRLAQIAPAWDLPVAWQVDRLRREQLDQAIDFLQRELARRPNAGLELKLAKPRLLVGAKRFAEARQAFDQLLPGNPNNPDLLYASGLMAYQMRDLSAAERHLRQALAAGHPETNFIRYTLGQIAEERQDVGAAKGWYEMVGAGPQFLPAQGRLAVMEAGDGKLELALARLAPLGGNDQEKITLALLQSQLAREAKQPGKAHDLLSKALLRMPKAPELLYERALVSDSLGNVGNAERDLKQVLKEKPGDAQALNALGYTLTNRTNRHQEALGYIEKALKSEPDNPTILDSLGWAQYKLGRLDAALKTLQKAYALLPDAELAAHLGEVLWKLGKKEEALAVWNKALEASPEHDVLRDTMRRLGAH
ncbi:tetratricopeptide repeat protein [Chromobacterium haemolyticum]|uniref:tetratricopeptide repeat protein n=1 Tax=Chromobacterium haemolyticum TaxID=394935 RepID=UPI0005B9286E|nr:tetratricopeptide repeat protein [Chromobacterium haemolyticum]